ncbi:hypothetical protein BGZ63DRAFT_430327 [Mariannaea sp. PMI_226]|nr:hypothetical protein BGZ63DRAFT_430327 [Mariannaea sp. PMI_226]
MPGADKKWDSNAERDLCLAIIMGNQESEKARHNWPRVHTLMTNLGHSFTKDAISQHFTKTIMREFKARHSGADCAVTASPTSASKKRATPRKRVIKPKAMIDANEDEDDEKHLEGLQTPSKKIKTESLAIKSEDDASCGRERSITVHDAEQEQEFGDWMDKFDH